MSLWLAWAVTGLTGCSVLPVRSFHTQIEIDAPPEAVWDVLADTARYAEWNPYHVKVHGPLRVGEDLDVLIVKPNGDQVELAPTVMRIEPPRELTWGGGIHGLFFGEHAFLIEPLDTARSLFVQKEEFKGLFVPFASLGSIEEGYNQMNEALKQRVEAPPR